MIKKNILFLHEGTFPEGFAMAFRLKMYFKMLDDNLFNYKIIVPRKSTIASIENNDSHIDYLWKEVVPQNKFLRKFLYIIQDFKWTIQLFKNRKNIDVIFVAAMSIFPLFLITLISKILGKKVILELNEYPYSSQGGNALDDLEIYKKYRRFITEKFIYKNIYGVVSISPKLSEYIIKINNQLKVVEIPVLCDVDYFKNIESLSPTEKKVPTHKFTVHASNLSEYKDGFSTNLKAIGEYNQSVQEIENKIHLIITLNGIPHLLESSLRPIIDHYQLNDYLHFVGYLDESELYNLYKNAEFLIINKPDNLQNTYNFPTKLSEYLYFGKILLVSTNHAMDQYLEKNVHCKKFESNNFEELTSFIQETMSLGNNFSYREASQRLVENEFDYKSNANEFNQYFTQI